MNILEKKVEGQVRFWSLLGPFLILLAIAIVLFKMSMHWYLPVGVLIGVPLCIKWKMPGLATALTCLFVLFLFSYPQIDLQERYWHLGIGMAVALSFVILTLSLEEVQNLIDKLQVESQSRLDNFLRLDETVKQLEESWRLEKEALLSSVKELSLEITETQEEKLTFQKLVYLAKDELIALRSQQELLLQDLVYKKQQIAGLTERLEESEMTIQGFINTESEQQARSLKTQIEDYKKQIDRLTEKQSELLKQQQEAFDLQLQDRISFVNQTKQQEMQKLKNDHLMLESQLKQSQQELKERSQVLERTVQELSSVKSYLDSSQRLLSNAQNQINQKEDLLRQHTEQIHTKVKEDFKRLENAKNEEITQLQQMQQDLNHKLRQAQREASEKGHILEKTTQELSSARSQLESLQQVVLDVKKQIQAKEELLESAQNGLEDKSEQLAATLFELDQAKKRLHSFEEEVKVVQEQVNQKAEQMQQLEHRCNQLDQDLKQATLEIEGNRQLIFKLKEEPRITPGRNTRGVEAMYSQLKQQFQEKSQILDETRKELFQAQEQLLVLQKELEEHQYFTLSENEWLLQRDLTCLAKEMEEIQDQNQQELDMMYGLIGDLLAKRK